MPSLLVKTNSLMALGKSTFDWRESLNFMSLGAGNFILFIPAMLGFCDCESVVVESVVVESVVVESVVVESVVVESVVVESVVVESVSVESVSVVVGIGSAIPGST